MTPTTTLKFLSKCTCALLLFSVAAFASANKINVQGTFLQNDAITPITGTGHVVDIRLYTNAIPTVGETIYFGEKHTGIDLATDGKFNILLGQGNLLPEVNIPLDNVSFDKQYFMEVTLDTVTVLGRQPLGSSGYASGSQGDFVVKNNLNVTGNSIINGNIGIGTSDLSRRLNIYNSGDQTYNDLLQLTNAYSVYGGNKPSLRFDNGGGSGFRVGAHVAGGDGLSFFIEQLDNEIPTSRFSIDGDGRVGIGTTSPDAKVTISGSAGSVFDIIKSAGLGDEPILRLYGDLSNGVPGDERLRILRDGRVGIGTSSPDGKVTINGTTGVVLNIIKSAGLPDEPIMRVWGDTVNGVPGDERFKILRDGRVGIGITNPFAGYTLTLNGAAWSVGGYWGGSDIRYKENIEDLPAGILGKVMNLKPIKYNFSEKIRNEKQMAYKRLVAKTDATHEALKDSEEEVKFFEAKQIGLSAQELEVQFPEIVHTDRNGYKAVAYEKLSVILIGAIKEQQSEIEALKQEITLLKNKK